MPYLATKGFAITAGEDDTAVWSDHGSFTVASCDMAVEGVPFDLGWMTAEDAGWRALALALGDLAAKGATPAWALTSVAVAKAWQMDDFVGLSQGMGGGGGETGVGVAKAWQRDDFVGLYKGMDGLAQKTGLLIVGGDMSSIDGPAVLSITVV